MVWKTRNIIAFRDEALSIQRLNPSLFFFIFWSKTEVLTVDAPLMLVDFIDWMGLNEDEAVFCTSFLFVFICILGGE